MALRNGLKLALDCPGLAWIGRGQFGLADRRIVSELRYLPWIGMDWHVLTKLCKDRRIGELVKNCRNGRGLAAGCPELACMGSALTRIGTYWHTGKHKG